VICLRAVCLDAIASSKSEDNDNARRNGYERTVSAKPGRYANVTHATRQRRADSDIVPELDVDAVGRPFTAGNPQLVIEGRQNH
jgi:hypothetical protein